MANIVELEVDTPRNGQLHFLPIAKNVRGRFDFARDCEPQAGIERAKYPDGVVPGQRLALDVDALEGAVIESLYEPRHAKVRAVIEKRGFGLPPEKEVFKLAKTDLPTWLYWMKRAVESGIAKVVRGKLPDKVEGEPVKSFISRPRGPDPKDATIAKLTGQNEKLIALLLAKSSPAERREFEALLGQ